MIKVSGNKIFDLHSSYNRSQNHVATCGGIVRHDGNAYFFTAGHPFLKPSPPPASNIHAFEGRSDLEGWTSAEHTMGHTADNPGIDTTKQKNDSICQDLEDERDVIVSSHADYALFRFENLGDLPDDTNPCDQRLLSDSGRTHVAIPDPECDEIRIVCHTASNGPMTGTLDGTPSHIRFPNSHKFRKVYEVQFDGTLAQGDCGSWVLDAETGTLYGHIVAGCERQGIGYLIPACDVFHDVAARLNKESLLDCELVLEILSIPTNTEMMPEVDTSSTKDHKNETRLGSDVLSPSLSSESEPSMTLETITADHAASQDISNITEWQDATEELTTSTCQDMRDDFSPRPQEGTEETACAHKEEYMSYPSSAPQSQYHVSTGNCHNAWPAIFAEPRVAIDWEHSNQPYLERYAERLKAEFPDVEGDLPDTFLNADFDDNDYIPQSDLVRNFCAGLGNDEGKEEIPRHVAWVDDRSLGGIEPHPQPCPGPLTAAGLFSHLIKPVRLRWELSTTQSCRRAKSHGDVFFIRGAPSGGYIANLNPTTIMTLIKTVSRTELFALRNAICKHLTAEASIGVHIPSRGFLAFNLAFHLPFFVCRTHTLKVEDHRRDAGGVPLRNSQDISFLNRWHQQESPTFLYEAHITCVISGIDDWTWVAYCFADTYFDGEDGQIEFEPQCFDHFEIDGPSFDPLTLGNLDANAPIWNPREYFLLVFSHRLLEVKKEWHDIVARLEQSMRRFEQDYLYPSTIAKSGHDALSTQDFESILQFVQLARKLQGSLAATIDACEASEHHLCSFFEGTTTDARKNPLFSIKSTLGELGRMKNRLGRLLDFSAQLLRNYEVRLNRETAATGAQQLALARDKRGFSWIMVLFVSPVALTSTIFSMNEVKIPFIRPSFAGFAGLVFVFSLLGIVLYTGLSYDKKGIVARELASSFVGLFDNAPPWRLRRNRALVDDIEAILEASSEKMEFSEVDYQSLRQGI
ncbi:hypothetical protein H2200_008295 [Cladophialophora chaetospira]|uniref:Uncharacterized protein n=1 Tax=Cladophialophora chaetospira TaxID=386627 RepID=A0AA39CGG9_9EURO|nr:hypothetical protein H2200_008295 [Cladophialophora chaetospira]